MSVQSQERASPELRFPDFVLQIGPSHPAMHGTIRILASLDGETIQDCDVQIGFLHRGFEKECEQRMYNQNIVYTDRLNYVSPMINNVGYCLAIEKLLGIEVPPRCQYIRVIASEISRIADHLTNIGAFAMELGALTVFLYCLKGRELMYDLHEALCGARVTTSFCRVGGVSEDVPAGFEKLCKAHFEKLKEVVRDVDLLLTKNPVVLKRLRNVGKISAEKALSYGFTGPLLRACGIPYDLRKVQPYLVYDQLEFDVPVGENGDNYDRYLVRLEEIIQSMRIVEQCLEKLPEGLYYVDDPAIFLPPKKEVYGSIEGLMSHFKLVMYGHGIKPPPGEIYFAVEGANGELGFYIVSDGSEKPYRVRCRAPSFCLMSGLHEMLKGDMLADLVPTFGSVNMIGGECDR